ncbi:hypothetical protein C7974DRAFT_390941 [Boeremia exigua]|uniref:uncharacterized protein n=1 Tax=Boeremia exigua TaxID=749465 RepID=UPI001E8D7610|nr:uncharacterized protein C7974DRAFT_390941 [Boeremia exigua]KAH6638136.1 hypothetical protein C7974DRAFT_390941 [Boeremia exigua]
MASTRLLSNLPPELICRMFEFAADFSTVAALAQTARPFYQTWRAFPTAICRAVAPRALFSHADAERLLDIQEEADPSQFGSAQRSISRAKRLLFNARCASAVTKDWIELCEIELSFDREHDPMRPSEIARFQHAFYCVWAIGVMATVPHLQHNASEFLEKCSPRELCRLGEMASYAEYYNHNDFGSVGLDFQDEVWKTGYDLASTRWAKVAYEGRHYRCVDGPKLNFFAFFDETQKYLETIDDE